MPGAAHGAPADRGSRLPGAHGSVSDSAAGSRAILIFSFTPSHFPPTVSQRANILTLMGRHTRFPPRVTGDSRGPCAPGALPAWGREGAQAPSGLGAGSGREGLPDIAQGTRRAQAGVPGLSPGGPQAQPGLRGCSPGSWVGCPPWAPRQEAGGRGPHPPALPPVPSACPRRALPSMPPVRLRDLPSPAACPHAQSLSEARVGVFPCNWRGAGPRTKGGSDGAAQKEPGLQPGV